MGPSKRSLGQHGRVTATRWPRRTRGTSGSYTSATTHIVDTSAMRKRFSGVSDWPYETTCPGVTLRSTMTPERCALTTMRVPVSAREAMDGSWSAPMPSVRRREAARSRSATDFR